MKRWFLALSLLAFLLGVCSPTWALTDTWINPNGDVKMRGSLFGPDDSVTWIHSLLEEGYDPESQEITSATVNLYLQDDSGCFDFWEFAHLDVGANAFFWEVNSGGVSFQLASLMTLSDTGKITSTLTACIGDFYFKQSILNADATPTNSASIPDPAPVFLLATAGLVGFVGTRKERRS